MTQNKKYKISPQLVYRYGPYLHTLEDQYEYSPALGFDKIKEDKHMISLINKLEAHKKHAERIEQDFYNLFGVNSALQFSKIFLLSNQSSENSQNNKGKIFKELLTILNQPSFSTILTKVFKTNEEGKVDEEYSAYAKNIEETIEKQIVAQNKELFKEFFNGDSGEDYYRKVFLNFLNKSKGKKGSTYTLTLGDNSVQFKAPQKVLTSVDSSYILDVIKTINPKAVKKPHSFDRNIKEVITSFEEIAKNRGVLSDEEIKWCATELKKELDMLKKTENNTGNISAFYNFVSAEGAIHEIIIKIGFKDLLKKEKKISPRILANDMVTRVEKNYTPHSFMNSGKEQITHYGKTYTKKFKSPTDLIIVDETNKTEYSIQLKSTFTTINKESKLKLQGEIQLPKFLNMVQGIIADRDFYKLLIYHIVNGSNFTSSKNTIDRLLSFFIEYIIKSRYADLSIEEVEENPSISGSNNKKNIGNLFFIYKNYLIPVSEFISFTIDQLKQEEKKEHIFLDNTLDYKVRYGSEELRGLGFKERIERGEDVYKNTKIGQLNIAIGAILNRMDYFEKAKV